MSAGNESVLSGYVNFGSCDNITVKDGLSAYIAAGLYITVLDEIGDDVVACFENTFAHTVNASCDYDVSARNNMSSFNNAIDDNIAGSLYFKVGGNVSVYLNASGKIDITG